MQTFLPYPDFAKSALVLDRQRLGKQRIEAWQILQAITTPSYGWQSHPAVNMWLGYEQVLYIYLMYICYEWRYNRKYKDTIWDQATHYMHDMNIYPSLNDILNIKNPPWLGNE